MAPVIGTGPCADPPQADPALCVRDPRDPDGARNGLKGSMHERRPAERPQSRALDLEQTLMQYVALYNTQLPQSVLGSRTPMHAMKDWHKSHPHLFVKSPRNLPGRDN